MIDIHCHILPELDDGAQSLEEAIALAKQAVAGGITKVIATPHHYARGYYSDYEQIKLATATLNDELMVRNIPLEVMIGQEIRVYDELLDHFEQGLLSTLNSSQYILIEFPSSKVPSEAEELFHELQLLNLTPIIAHPERNAELANDPALLTHLVRGGALAQLTSSSITGKMGRKLQKQSIEMCKNGDIHFIASDAHHCEKRPFDLLEGYEAISRHLGADFTNYYQLNASRLLRNDDIIREVPAMKRRFIFW